MSDVGRLPEAADALEDRHAPWNYTEFGIECACGDDCDPRTGDCGSAAEDRATAALLRAIDDTGVAFFGPIQRAALALAAAVLGLPEAAAP